MFNMREMVTNILNISPQRRQISFAALMQNLSMENFFLIHRWQPQDLRYAFYKEQKLQTIHRSCGHPSVRYTGVLCKRASGGLLSLESKDAIQNIEQECGLCMIHAAPPRRFKLTVASEDLRFTQSVQVDTMFLLGKPVLHMIDMTTHVCASRFLRSQIAKERWPSIQTIWSLAYVGPPDHLTVDQGSSYVSMEICSNLQGVGVTLHEADVKNL